MISQQITVLYVRILIDFLSAQNYKEKDILSGTGIQVGSLANDGATITPRQHAALIENAYNLTKDPLIGIRFGQQLNLTAHGFLGFAVLSSQNLTQALQLFLRYAKTRTQLVNISFNRVEDKGFLTLKPSHVVRSAYPFVVETVLTTLIITTRFLTKRHISECQIHLSQSKPACWRMYSQLLGVPVHFSQAEDALVFPMSILKSRLSMADNFSVQQAVQACDRSLKLIDQRRSIVERVQELLYSHDHVPLLNEAASQLNVSVRSLSRQLAASDTSYQALVDDYRLERSCQLLQSGHVSIMEIGYQLGYKNATSFCRAFKQWTNMTPSEYRRQQHPEPVAC